LLDGRLSDVSGIDGTSPNSFKKVLGPVRLSGRG
jgi:hypothetical protein